MNFHGACACVCGVRESVRAIALILLNENNESKTKIKLIYSENIMQIGILLWYCYSQPTKKAHTHTQQTKGFRVHIVQCDAININGPQVVARNKHAQSN